MVLDVNRGGLELPGRGGQGAPARPLGVEVHSALFDQVRTCDNHCEFCFIYQLPPGMRVEPLPQGRRLPALVPLRELHDPHPLHRGRPRAGGDRAAVAAERQHPRHRPRRAHRPAAQPAGRHQPALAAGPARPRHRGPRPGRGLPGRQRRRRARRHAGRRARPVPRAGQPVRGAARREPLVRTRPACGPHTRAEAEAVVDAVHDWQDVYLATLGHRLVLRGRRVLPAGRPAFPERRGLRGLRHARGRHRHGPHASSASSAARSTSPTGVRVRASSPGSTARRPRATARRAPAPAERRPAPVAAAAVAPTRAGRRPHRAARRPGARPAGGRARTRRRAGDHRAPTSSSAATSGSPA